MSCMGIYGMVHGNNTSDKSVCNLSVHLHGLVCGVSRTDPCASYIHSLSSGHLYMHNALGMCIVQKTGTLFPMASTSAHGCMYTGGCTRSKQGITTVRTHTTADSLHYCMCMYMCMHIML